MRILFTIAFLDGFHGSVKHVLEHASFLHSANGGNHQITIATIFATEKIKLIFKKSGIDVYLLNSVPLDICYDIVFAYHFPTIEMLLSYKLKCKKLVLGSLSSFASIETFPLWWSNASMLITISHEAQQSHHEKYAIPLERIRIMENCIPDAFFQYELNKNYGSVPQKIAVISNHPPEELYQLPPYFLNHHNIKVDFVGINQAIYTDITPAFLANYDLVISIGKTVQYALGMGIPVYEYDYFGGAGYITPHNIVEEACYNFSGRPTYRKLTSESIAMEILQNYHTACHDTQTLKNISGERFLLSKNMKKLMEEVHHSPDFSLDTISAIPYNHILNLAHGSTFAEWALTYKEKIKTLEKKLLEITMCYEKSDHVVHFNDVKHILHAYLKQKLTRSPFLKKR